MENKFIYSDDIKRYHTWNYHLRHMFGTKVFKVSLNGGFTCPNRDGTKGTGGCTFCSDFGSGDFAGDPSETVVEQFYSVAAQLHKKWRGCAKYIPYFQANTNTYAPTETLRALYEPVLALDGVVGLSIATRPDCISDDCLEYLKELNSRTYLIAELGLQSVFDETGQRINRCHTYADFLSCYKRLTDAGIRVCIHLINGLPGETRDMMMESARCAAALRPHCVKLHLLHVLRGTRLCEQYERGEFDVLGMEEYIDIITEQLRLFPPETVIQRLTGDGGADSLIAPRWTLKKFVVLNEIDKLMIKKDAYQGDRYLTNG